MIKLTWGQYYFNLFYVIYEGTWGLDCDTYREGDDMFWFTEILNNWFSGETGGNGIAFF